MKMLLSVMLGIVVMVLYGIAEQRFSGRKVIRFNTNALEDESPIRIRFSRLNWSGWAAGAIIGAIVALANYLAPKFAPLAPVWLVAMIAIYAYLVVVWRVRGRTILGFLAFFALAILMCATTTASAYMTAELFNVEQNGIAERILLLIPKLAVIITIAACILDTIFLQSDARLVEEDRESVSQGRVLRWIGRAVALATVLALLGTSLNAFGVNFNWPSREVKASDGQDNDEAAEAAATVPFYAFYNLPLSENDNPSDDLNFGYNPREYHPEWEKAENAAELFDADFRERMAGSEDGKKGADVALAAADMAWLDANVGTRYLGTFYESCKEDWALTMNEAKVAFMNDEELYRQRQNAFFRFLDYAVEVKVTEAIDMDDQMYMNPFTEDGIPDIIVFTSNDHKGLFLTYVFEIKGERVEVSYRIDCGYQPTNVEKIMKITPQPNPIPPEPDPPTPPEDTPDPPTPPTPPDTPPGDTPTPKPQPKKDPADDPVNNGNADKGGGDNKPGDGSGEEQKTDPRDENPTGNDNDNNQGHSDPGTVTPETPTIPQGNDSREDQIDYKPDPVTNRGPVDTTQQPTADGGDGEFTPED